MLPRLQLLLRLDFLLDLSDPVAITLCVIQLAASPSVNIQADESV
jgi:hypothetical protein